MGTALASALTLAGIPPSFPSFGAASEAVDTFSKGGGFVLTTGRSENLGVQKWWDGRLSDTDRQGRVVPRPSRGRLELLCNRATTRSGGGRGSGVNQTATVHCGCRFKIVLLQNEGDACVNVTGACLKHNGHDLMTPQQLASETAVIPAALLPDLDLLAGCLHRIKPSIIDELLKAKAAVLQLPAAWSRKDLRNLIYRRKPSYVEVGDAQSLAAALARYKAADASFVYSIDVDPEENRMSRLFWMLPFQRRKVERYYVVISFDDTFHVMRYKAALCDLVGIDKDGKSVPLGQALIDGKDTASYVWVFEEFKAQLPADPSVIMSDGDLAIAAAIAIVFPNSRHLLCTWHLKGRLEGGSFDAFRCPWPLLRP